MKCPCCKRLMPDDLKRCGGCVDGVTYIYYPKETIYYENDRGAKTNMIWGEKPEHIPSSPPWTTFNGLLEADINSFIGQKLLIMDPNHSINGSRIRGLWTA